MHKLAWGSYAHGAPGNCPACSGFKTALLRTTLYGEVGYNVVITCAYPIPLELYY